MTTEADTAQSDEIAEVWTCGALAANFSATFNVSTPRNSVNLSHKATPVIISPLLAA